MLSNVSTFFWQVNCQTRAFEIIDYGTSWIAIATVFPWVCNTSLSTYESHADFQQA